MNRKLKFTLIFFCISLAIIGQDIHNQLDSVILLSGAESRTKMNFLSEDACEKAGELAKEDIKNKKINLFLVGGIAPVVYTTDKEFEEKYKIVYVDYGCISPKLNCLINYNETVFNYLNQEYGKKWRKEIRKDVIGLKNWKRNKKALQN